MACTNLKQIYYTLDSTGVKRLHFKHFITDSLRLEWIAKKDISLFARQDLVTIPCGKCKSCRLAKAKEWALRCCLESRYYKDSWFLTLTYKDQPLTERKRPTLVRKHLQDFMKRLRITYERMHLDFGPVNFDLKLKYFGCGEYGGRHGRPHYHLILFNLKIHDLKFHCFSKSNKNYPLYISNWLEEIWSHGYVKIGRVSLDSAGYVARYTLKKDQAAEDYTLNYIYGPREKEFLCMSNGLGKKFFEEFSDNIYRLDSVHYDKKEYKVPRYFDRLLEKKDADLYISIKEKRAKLAFQFLVDDNRKEAHLKQTSYRRLQDKAEKKDLDIKPLVRSYEQQFEDIAC